MKNLIVGLVVTSVSLFTSFSAIAECGVKVGEMKKNTVYSASKVEVVGDLVSFYWTKTKVKKDEIAQPYSSQGKFFIGHRRCDGSVRIIEANNNFSRLVCE